MNWLRKLPGYQRSAPGLEWVLLRLIPKLLAVGTALPLLLAGAGRIFIKGDTTAALARQIQLLDYMMIGVVVFIWTLALTVTIGCIVVWLMKGPAYVADGFDVSHSDDPRG